MNKSEILYNRLLKLFLFIAGISFFFFVIDLFLAIATQAIDCSNQVCQVTSDHPLIRLTLLVFAAVTVVFIILSRIVYHRISKEEKLIDVRTYRSKMAAKDQTSTKSVTFSQTKLYQEIIQQKQADAAKKTETATVVAETTKKKVVIEEPIEEEIEETIEATPENIIEEPIEETTEAIPEEIIEEPIDETTEAIPEEIIEEPIKEEVKIVATPTVSSSEENVKKPAKSKKKVVTHTKADMIEYLVEHTELNKSKSNKFLKYFAETVKDTLANNEEVDIPDFGLFTTIEMPEKEAMNPQTQEIMLVDAHRQVRLRFTDSLKELVNSSIEDEDEAFDEEIESDTENDTDNENDIEEAVKVLEKEKLIETETIPKDPVVGQQSFIAEPLVKVKKKHAVASKKTITRTKADLIDQLNENEDFNKNKSNKFLKAFAEVIIESLAKNVDVALPGFGLFTTIEMPAKEAMNPQTKKIMLVDAHKQARLRFDEEFKDIFKDLDCLTLTQLHLDIDDSDSEEEDDDSNAVNQTDNTNDGIKEIAAVEIPIKKVTIPHKAGQTKTKKDMIEYLVLSTDLNKSASNKFLNSFADVVKNVLAKREDIDLPGFGLFTTIEMPEKEAMNPQTKKIMVVPSHHQARLRFSDEFKSVFKD